MKKFFVILQMLLMVGSISAKEFALANIKGNNVSDGQTKLVTNALRSHLMRESKGDAVAPNVMGTDITIDQTKLLSLGKEIGANTIIGGTISAKGQEFILNLSLYNVKSSSKLGIITIKTEDGFGGVMQKVLAEAAKKIVSKDIKPSGKIVDKKEKKIAKKISFMVKSSTKGAKVSVNGEEKGLVPYQLSLEPGDYKISVALDGYETSEKTVSVNSKIKDISFDLKQINIKKVAVDTTEKVSVDTTDDLSMDDEVVAGEPTNAIIGTQPEGAEISLDGNYIGISNLLYKSTTGPHQISIKMDGYQDTTFYVVFNGENSILDVPLFANEVSKDFADVSGGIKTKTIIRISMSVVAVGSFVGGIVLNSQVGSLNTDLENATKEGDITKATEIGDKIRSKQSIRNILYGVSTAATIGFGVTFFIN